MSAHENSNQMNFSHEPDDGISQPVAVLLLTAITVIFAAILLALILGMLPVTVVPYEIPEVLAITDIRHTNPDGKVTYASIVRLQHVGITPLWNADHRAELYVNGVLKYAVISTLQGHEFISTHHYGVATLAGTGIKGYQWLPGQWGLVNFADQTILPNDQVEIRILCISENRTISKSVRYAPPLSGSLN